MIKNDQKKGIFIQKCPFFSEIQSKIDSYNGMFPCFLRGKFETLFSSISNA
jgi:hypothetical protein